jgi:hypothetical protein
MFTTNHTVDCKSTSTFPTAPDEQQRLLIRHVSSPALGGCDSQMVSRSNDRDMKYAHEFGESDMN